MPQVDELIKQLLSSLIQKKLPDDIISVTQVKVSKDLGYAKIWIAAVKDTNKAVKECQEKAKDFQKELSSKIEIRKIPHLHFVPDNTSEKVDRIEKLINQIKNEK